MIHVVYLFVLASLFFCSWAQAACQEIQTYEDSTAVIADSEVCFSFKDKEHTHINLEIYSKIPNATLLTEAKGMGPNSISLIDTYTSTWIESGESSTAIKIEFAEKHQQKKILAAIDYLVGVPRVSIVILPNVEETISPTFKSSFVHAPFGLSYKDSLHLLASTKSTTKENPSLCNPSNTSPVSPVHFSASLNNNILTSIDMSRTPLPVRMLWFKDIIGNKRPWDFKQMDPQYADYGNYHYGAVGAALGIPAEVLLRLAGWAQMSAGTSAENWGHYLGFSPYGDDPNDQAWIKRGMNYYNDVFTLADNSMHGKYSDFCNDENNKRMVGQRVTGPFVGTRVFSMPEFTFPQVVMKCSGCHRKGSVTITDIKEH